VLAGGLVGEGFVGGGGGVRCVRRGVPKYVVRGRGTLALRRDRLELNCRAVWVALARLRGSSESSRAFSRLSADR